MDFPNKGIFHTEDGKVVAVKGTIPGQRIRCRVTKTRNGVAQAGLQEVLERGADEKPADCPHFARCGGCAFRTLSYDRQLELKEQAVRKLLENAVTDGQWEGIKASPRVEAYRNKMEFTFGDEIKDGPMSLGMHARGSFHDIITVDECCIVDPDFRLILKSVLRIAAESGQSYYHRMSQKGYFRHLLVRKAVYTEDILVDLITTTQTDPADAMAIDVKLTKALLALEDSGRLKGHIKGILHTKNDSQADAVINQGTIILHGEDYFYEELLGLKFKISPFSFFQTNSLGAEVLYSAVRDYIGSTKDKIIFDLYSGTGTIAQLLAEVAKSVTGVEIVEEAVEAARENAAMNGLDNCHFIAGDVLKVVDELTEKPDLIVLDPPRDGIHPKALPKIIRFGVDRIVYVSCKPTSLARDLEVLRQAGYEVERACGVDMFPGTPQVETVCLLSKKAPV